MRLWSRWQPGYDTSYNGDMVTSEKRKKGKGSCGKRQNGDAQNNRKAHHISSCEWTHKLCRTEGGYAFQPGTLTTRCHELIKSFNGIKESSYVEFSCCPFSKNNRSFLTAPPSPFPMCFRVFSMVELRCMLESCPIEKRLPLTVGSVKPSITTPSRPFELGAWNASPTRTAKPKERKTKAHSANKQAYLKTHR